MGHLLQKCGDLFDVVGRYLGRTEHARRLRLFRAEHVDRLLEHRDVERFRLPRQVLMPRFSSLLYLYSQGCSLKLGLSHRHVLPLSAYEGSVSALALVAVPSRGMSVASFLPTARTPS